MHTLFVPMLGFFPGRHQTFIQTLCKHFNVIVHEDLRWNITGKNVFNTSKISTEIGDVEKLDEFQTQWRTYRTYIARVAAESIGHQPDANLLNEHFQKIRPLLAESLKRALVLFEMVRQQRIDMVVTGADYIHYNRPFTFAAAKLGIPSVHIEHGLLALTPYPSNPELESHIRFASNYVVLDNELEVDIFSRYRRQANVTQLLPLGAPLDNSVACLPISEIDAKQFLGIPKHRKCVTVVLSWSEPTTPNAMVKYQQMEIEFVKTLFEAWRQSSCREGIHLIVKIHPAIRDFGELHGYKMLIRHIACTYGILPNLSIELDHLTEVVSASALVISWKASSVLWDAIMQNRKTALWYHISPAQQNEGLPMKLPLTHVTEAGVCTYFNTIEEAKRLFADILNESTVAQQQQTIEQFKRQWHLQKSTAHEKSVRIVEWMKQMLSIQKAE
ncbi:MAG: glycosyltransferase [Deltaproteobacteria bacterium]|nr:glycosyltransferase [Deltaproteobacteria bacterium]